MKTRRLEEILEECLSAYLDQGRSVEESLRLYAAYRGQLEPLLRTALEVSGTFQSYSPPDHIQERGLARFLSDARARKNLRTLTLETKPGWLAGLLTPQRRLQLGGIAAALVVGAVIVGTATIGGSSSDREGFAINPPTTPPTSATAAPETPEVVRSVQQSVTAIRAKVRRGESPDASEIALLTEAVSNLGAKSGSEIDAALTAVEQTIRDADAVLQEVLDADPAAANDPTVKEAIDTTRDVAGGFGISLDETPTPTEAPATEDPQATPTDTETAPPTDGPTPSTTDPPTDTPVPTAAPTEQETPTTRGVGL